MKKIIKYNKLIRDRILGIRLISNGWGYNISGSRKAIEIQMITGKKCQISTNDWQKLEQAIEQTIKQKRD